MKIIGLISALLSLSFFVIGCASKTTICSCPVNIAVWPFEDFTVESEQDSSLLSFVMTNAVIDVIQGNPALEAVERSRLDLILKEQSLGSGVLADESTRLRLGRILGAKWMLFGTWQTLKGYVRIDVRIVDTESGRILAAKDKTINKITESQLDASTRDITNELLSETLDN